MKQLIVNADDFGFTRDVNQGIIQAHREGILTATTLMATGDGVRGRGAARQGDADAGCRLSLVLVGRGSVPDERGGAGARRRCWGASAIYDALRGAGSEDYGRGDRADASRYPQAHASTAPGAWRRWRAISEEFQIPWVRRPFDFRGQPGGIGWKNSLMHLRSGGFAADAGQARVPVDGLVRGVPDDGRL